MAWTKATKDATLQWVSSISPFWVVGSYTRLARKSSNPCVMLSMKWEGCSDGDGSIPSDGEEGDGHGY